MKTLLSRNYEVRLPTDVASFPSRTDARTIFHFISFTSLLCDALKYVKALKHLLSLVSSHKQYQITYFYTTQGKQVSLVPYVATRCQGLSI
jgi:hypothetical protein